MGLFAIHARMSRRLDRLKPAIVSCRKNNECFWKSVITPPRSLLRTCLFCTLLCLISMRSHADTLVLDNGDEITGTLIGTEGDTLIFESPRFGILKIPSETARVERSIQAEGLPDEEATPKPTDTPQQKPAVVPDKLHRGIPWEGRFSTSTEILHNTQSEQRIKVDFRLEKRWRDDEFRFKPRYEFKQSDGVTETDVFNADIYYRHDLPHRLFVLYAPQIEEDRDYRVSGLPLDYRLVRQELGGGVRVVEHDKSVLRLGLARNHYGLRLLNYSLDATLWSTSLFAEAELDLPFEIDIRNRGEYHRYEETDAVDGWENEFEISKRLIGAVVLSLKHEYRRNAPEIKGEDYSKFVFLVGVDF